jgi:RND superfamily putative drug exporter
MFASWGRLLAAQRRLVAVLAGLSLLLVIATMVTVGPNLQTEGFVADNAESTRVDEALATDFGRGSDAIVFLFDTEQPVDDPASRRAVDAALQPLAGDARFGQPLTTWSTGNPDMISADGMATYAVVRIAPDADIPDSDLEQAMHAVEEAAEAEGLSVTTGGGGVVGLAIDEEVEQGLIRAETFAVPMTLVIQVVVFGSLIAAGVPLLIGLLAILGSLAAVFVLSTDTFQSVFAINVITMLGLALGVDYSLFMVTRFREEIARRPTTEAIAVTMATVGKAILFSGITVIFGLAATQFFPMPALRSIGQAGMIVTALALVYGLTLLPAVLAMLGPRINALSIGRRSNATSGTEAGLWHGIAQRVMRYPVQVFAGVVLALLVAGIPVLRLDITPGGPEVLPDDQGPRIVNERLAAEFPNGDAEPIPVLVTVNDGSPTSAENVAALQALSAQLVAVPNVTGVQSFVSPGPSDYDWAGYNGNPATLPEPIADAVDSTVRGDEVLVQVSSTATASSLEDVVRDIRALDPAGVQVMVGGSPAAGVDTVDGIYDGILPAAIFVLVGSYLILLLTFGSVFLPLKAILMTLLSISASLGAVVFVFQDGNLQSLFGFESTGEIISVTPIFMFCFLFGLSMDYEVLMLSRIQEEYERTGDNRASVAFGLSQTGKVITGAAAIMVVVFGGFMLADIVIIKSLGFGLAMAVLIDATVVRGLLVPATMRLMGRWNWWAPAPVRRVVDRLGLAHHTIAPEPSAGD